MSPAHRQQQATLRVSNWCCLSTYNVQKSEGRRRGGRQRMRWLDGITDKMDMSLSTPTQGTLASRLLF